MVFLVATFGEGEPTDSAVKFNTWLTDASRAQDQLNSVPFAVRQLSWRMRGLLALVAYRGPCVDDAMMSVVGDVLSHAVKAVTVCWLILVVDALCV